MPPDVDGVAAGAVCPNNAYVHKHQVFVNRDSVMDTVDRLFRLYRSAELGLVSESNLDTLATTELLTTKMELDRQSHERQKRASEQARMEAQLEADSNRRKRFEE